MPLVSTTFDVVLQDNDAGLVVLGPPTIEDISLNIGPQGERGSQVFTGGSDPNTYTPATFSTQFGQTPKYRDVFIRTDAGSNYGTFYSYVNTPGGDQWSPTLYMVDIVDEYFYLNPSALADLANSASATIIDIVQDYISGSAGITFLYGVTVNQNLHVGGNLTVDGSMNFDSNQLTMNVDVTGTPTENVSFIVERGTSPNVNVRWNETDDKWEFTNDGSLYQKLGSVEGSEIFATQFLLMGA